MKTKWCPSCNSRSESHYDRYGYGSESRSWCCNSVLEVYDQISSSQAISCGQRASTYSSGTNYCQYSGCFTQSNIINGYCSTHSSHRSNTGWGYSYSSSGSICQAEDCSRRTSSSSETYCQVCKPIQALNRKVENRGIISRPVKDTVEFTTWWNKNLATAVNGDGYFTIYLLVYDDKESRIKPFQSSSSDYSLSSAKSQASTLRSNLNGNNPILYIHPKANSYDSFGEIVNADDYNGFVKRIDLPYTVIGVDRIYLRKALRLNPDGTVQEVDVYDTITKIDLRNPELYLKPFDIVWVETRKLNITYHHVCVYLGNNEVCHVAGDIFNKKGARVESWRDFMEGATTTLFAFRTIIPFKNFKQIAQQIDWVGANYFTVLTSNLFRN